MKGQQGFAAAIGRLLDGRGGRFDSAAGDSSAAVPGPWELEGRVGPDGTPRCTRIETLPFRIGRSPELDLVLPGSQISKTHAEIYADARNLRLRDLSSRNGTFLNGQCVADAKLHSGDILHFGDLEFRLVQGGAKPKKRHDDTTSVEGHWRPREIRELLREGTVTTCFQPIVHLPFGRVAACEALGRGRHPRLPEGPVELFETAAQIGPEAQTELSRLFRRTAVEQARDRLEPPVLFLNTHPGELGQEGLVESIEELRTIAPHLKLVLEIHESTLALADLIRSLRARLSDLDVDLAYDDFGAGEARLFELAEEPPNYLKFDRRLITGLDHAPESRQRLVAALVAAAHELLVQTVAEGVETAGEAEACRRAGFTHAQGYYFGQPEPVDPA
jgi:EAL domain-containing protein (putative c-di-GMP-specific phosphodiesterase class I)